MVEFSFLPTKANLLKLKEEIRLVEDGYNLLDHKREVLIRELLRYAFEMKDLKERVNKCLRNTYDKFFQSVKKIGRNRLKILLLEKPNFPEVKGLERSIMGVHMPTLKLLSEFKVNFPSPSLSCKEFDEFLLSLQDLVPLLLRYVELNFSLFRISQELIKTQKRLRALENFHIPQYKERISYIETALEESEREELFRNKKIKSRWERREDE
ncbi:hypothetical protein DRN98_10245 [Methanosarcinales archaeon]|nr:MAG: hypothetical protein DRN98_10245 [Methanosarcinales archaeon]